MFKTIVKCAALVLAGAGISSPITYILTKRKTRNECYSEYTAEMTRMSNELNSLKKELGPSSECKVAPIPEDIEEKSDDGDSHPSKGEGKYKRIEQMLNASDKIASFKSKAPVTPYNEYSSSKRLEDSKPVQSSDYKESVISSQAQRIKQMDYIGYLDDGDLGYDEHGDPIRTLFIEDFDHISIDYYPRDNIYINADEGTEMSESLVNLCLGKDWKLYFGQPYPDGMQAESDDNIYIRNYTQQSDYEVVKFEDTSYNPKYYENDYKNIFDDAEEDVRQTYQPEAGDKWHFDSWGNIVKDEED